MDKKLATSRTINKRIYKKLKREGGGPSSFFERRKEASQKFLQNPFKGDIIIQSSISKE